MTAADRPERPTDIIATCQTCDRPIRYGQPYMPRIPFLAGWRGFVHQFCPPRLVVTKEHP